MQTIEEVLENVHKVIGAGGEARVEFVVREERQEIHSIDVGPTDFRTTIKYADFNDLNAKLAEYKKALDKARQDGIAAMPKPPKA